MPSRGELTRPSEIEKLGDDNILFSSLKELEESIRKAEYSFRFKLALYYPLNYQMALYDLVEKSN